MAQLIIVILLSTFTVGHVYYLYRNSRLPSSMIGIVLLGVLITIMGVLGKSMSSNLLQIIGFKVYANFIYVSALGLLANILIILVKKLYILERRVEICESKIAASHPLYRHADSSKDSMHAEIQKKRSDDNANRESL